MTYFYLISWECSAREAIDCAHAFLEARTIEQVYEALAMFERLDNSVRRRRNWPITYATRIERLTETEFPLLREYAQQFIAQIEES